MISQEHTSEPISNHAKPNLLKLHQKLNEEPIEKIFKKYESVLNHHEDNNSLKNSTNIMPTNLESNRLPPNTPRDYGTRE